MRALELAGCEFSSNLLMLIIPLEDPNLQVKCHDREQNIIYGKKEECILKKESGQLLSGNMIKISAEDNSQKNKKF